ncbi:MAG: hypothetical protein OEW60_07015 [Thiovulaceae bacterium]|nr:hypothetical protein [Sulfurimonadaceae bacterium]
MECADAFGGKNFFLQLLEAIRKEKPHPLLAKHAKFSFEMGTITWEKVIFKDKLDLLLRIRVNESKTGNLLPDKNDKNFKKVMNLIRTLAPVEFDIKPSSDVSGIGFSVKAFDMINETTTRINPLFDMLFFCSIETAKKVLNYTPKA